MLVEEIDVQELLKEIEIVSEKSRKWKANKNERNSNELKKIVNKIKKKYLKTSDSNTVIDLISTISNNNEIIDLKPSNLIEIINENKEEFNNLIKKKKINLKDIIKDDIFQEILIQNDSIIRKYIKNNKKNLYSLIYENNPEKYYNLINLYSIYFGDSIIDQKHLFKIVEKAFLDDSIPDNWEISYDKESESYYYYNKENDESRWDNPNIDLWKRYIEIEKKKYKKITQNSNNRKIEKKNNYNESDNMLILLDINDEDYDNYNSYYDFSSSTESSSPELRRSPRIRDLTKRNICNQVLGNYNNL